MRKQGFRRGGRSSISTMRCATRNDWASRCSFILVSRRARSCEYANRNTFAFDALRKRYTDHYVLAYFDIRGNPADVISLPDGAKLTRAEAIKRLKASPVPAWMFVGPDGREILMRRGSRTRVDAFMKFDLYVASGAYRRSSFDDFLARRGLREDKVE